MAREILVPHSDIDTPDKITREMEKRFKEKDLNIHNHEVTSLEDCYKTKTRIIQVKNTKYFMMPQAPWLKDKK